MRKFRRRYQYVSASYRRDNVVNLIIAGIIPSFLIYIAHISPITAIITAISLVIVIIAIILKKIYKQDSGFFI